MMSWQKKFGVLILLMGLVNSVFAKGAGMESADLFDGILQRFQVNAQIWERLLKSTAEWLFWGLALISMTWTYGLMALKRQDIQEFFAETIQFFAVLGFFYWILDHGPAIASAIIDSLRKIASKASNLPNDLTPSGIVDVGFEIVYKVIDNSSIWSPANAIVGMILGGIILIVLALVGVNMLLVLISAWFVIYGGIFLLGFGGGRWTQDIAINYYRTVLGIALEAFAMVLIIGIGKSFIDQYYAATSSSITLKELFIMLVVSMILLRIMNTIPSKLAGMVSGGGHGGGGGIGLGAAMGAASMASAAMSSGVAAATSGVMNAAGAGSAVQAAAKSASQSMNSGGIPPLSGPPQSSMSRFGSTIGQMGRFAGSMGSHLASGAKDVAQEKLNQVRESLATRVQETPGGQIAEAINQRAEECMTSSPETLDLGEGSLRQGFDVYDDEVTQFMHKNSRSGD